MPIRPPTACQTRGCLGYAVALGRCEAHAAPILAAREAARSSEPGRQWYQTTRWQALRLAVLNRQPLCVMCQYAGRVTPATDVDHIERHAGDSRRFWDMKNLQPLCRAHHIEKTKAERRR
jgi:5-methylcytosine-specific restriction protein A